jgi:hypothetical protein
MIWNIYFILFGYFEEFGFDISLIIGFIFINGIIMLEMILMIFV